MSTVSVVKMKRDVRKVKSGEKTKYFFKYSDHNNDDDVKHEKLEGENPQTGKN